MYSDELQKVAKDSLFVVMMRPVRVLGIIAYTSSTDKEVPVLCKVTEDRYKVEDGYKIELKSIDSVEYENKKRRVTQYGRESYYTSDLASLIRSGHVRRITVVDRLQQKLNTEQLMMLVRVM